MSIEYEKVKFDIKSNKIGTAKKSKRSFPIDPIFSYLHIILMKVALIMKRSRYFIIIIVLFVSGFRNIVIINLS